jgi:hypothetical protein
MKNHLNPRRFKVAIGFSLGLLATSFWLIHAAEAGTLPASTSVTIPSLESGWQNPPNEARLRAYWWWLNGNVTQASITRELEQMKFKGFGGATLFDANGSSQGGNAPVPHGPTFFSPAWRELYKHTLREASRLGLTIGLNIQSGWNLGGPVVSQDDAAKKYVWTEQKITGGKPVTVKLPEPKKRDGYYRDIVVLAYRVKNAAPRPPLENWEQKALQQSLKPFSTPDSSPLFAEYPSTPGEEDADIFGVTNLTKNLSPDGTLRWDAPDGDWQILRFGYTIGDHAYVSTSSDGWNGYALDVYSADAFQHYWNKIVEPLIEDAGPLAGKTLKYLHTDSWEIELANWTPKLREEFQKRHGYDMTPWLPVLAGRIINSREQSDRFLFDYRQTLGDLAIDDHYRLFRDNAHKHGLEIHPESGGPHAVPIDAQRCLGWDDAPMSEFWAWSWEHRIGDANRFFLKQPASAAHTYGHKLVLAEGFTTIGPNWQSRIWNNLKPSFDKALCEGLNVLVWHAFVCSPESEGIPGQQYFAGTHLNPNVTWWGLSAPFFSYINRCQWMLQQGHFDADVLYYYGDHVPNFTQLKASDPAHILPGYDYDVITAEALIDRASVKDGRIVLPDGLSYRLLVIPDRDEISLAVLKKIKKLVVVGATIVGPKPVRGETLAHAAATDAEVKKLADELWGGPAGAGRVIADKTARQILLADGVLPDCEFLSADGQVLTNDLDYIHRTDGGAEIYFVMNRSTNSVDLNCSFRVSGKAPELWDAVTGDHKFADADTEANGRTLMPLHFAPCGSWFVVFREPASAHPTTAKSNEGELKSFADISGPWTVHFDPQWGGPASVQFDSLASWTARPEPGIKYYSGTATYDKTFNLPQSAIGKRQSNIYLDLGDVHELAGVKLNGQSCGIVWCPPWRVDVTDAVKAGENKLEVEVVNFWPNRIIGDASLPPDQRFTRTNIRNLTSQTPLMESGLLGPVRLLELQPRMGE